MTREEPYVCDPLQNHWHHLYIANDFVKTLKNRVKQPFLYARTLNFYLRYTAIMQINDGMARVFTFQKGSILLFNTDLHDRSQGLPTPHNTLYMVCKSNPRQNGIRYKWLLEILSTTKEIEKKYAIPQKGLPCSSRRKPSFCEQLARPIRYHELVGAIKSTNFRELPQVPSPLNCRVYTEESKEKVIMPIDLFIGHEKLRNKCLVEAKYKNLCLFPTFVNKKPQVREKGSHCIEWVQMISIQYEGKWFYVGLSFRLEGNRWNAKALQLHPNRMYNSHVGIGTQNIGPFPFDPTKENNRFKKIIFKEKRPCKFRNESIIYSPEMFTTIDIANVKISLNFVKENLYLFSDKIRQERDLMAWLHATVALQSVYRCFQTYTYLGSSKTFLIGHTDFICRDNQPLYMVLYKFIKNDRTLYKLMDIKTLSQLEKRYNTLNHLPPNSRAHPTYRTLLRTSPFYYLPDNTPWHYLTQYKKVKERSDNNLIITYTAMQGFVRYALQQLYTVKKLAFPPIQVLYYAKEPSSSPLYEIGWVIFTQIPDKNVSHLGVLFESKAPYCPKGVYLSSKLVERDHQLLGFEEKQAQEKEQIALPAFHVDNIIFKDDTQNDHSLPFYQPSTLPGLYAPLPPVGLIIQPVVFVYPLYLNIPYNYGTYGHPMPEAALIAKSSVPSVENQPSEEEKGTQK
ncbi:MAG: hypothetical protein AAF335_03055 [Bacteroidota bacterium]